MSYNPFVKDLLTNGEHSSEEKLDKVTLEREAFNLINSFVGLLQKDRDFLKALPLIYFGVWSDGDVMYDHSTRPVAFRKGKAIWSFEYEYSNEEQKLRIGIDSRLGESFRKLQVSLRSRRYDYRHEHDDPYIVVIGMGEGEPIIFNRNQEAVSKSRRLLEIFKSQQ